MKTTKPQESFKLYNEELEYCLKRGGSMRKVSIMTTIIEAQVAWLAQGLMESKNFKYKPYESQEFNFYQEVLKSNLNFYKGFWEDLSEFRKQRKFILHNVFKERRHSREDLERSIRIASDKGAIIIHHLDERLIFLGTSEK